MCVCWIKIRRCGFDFVGSGIDWWNFISDVNSMQRGSHLTRQTHIEVITTERTANYLPARPALRCETTGVLISTVSEGKSEENLLGPTKKKTDTACGIYGTRACIHAMLAAFSHTLEMARPL